MGLDKFIGFAFDYMKMSNTMIQLTNEQINEIADNLIFGFRCFVNIKTGEIKEMIGDIQKMKTDLHAHMKKCKSGDAPVREIAPADFKLLDFLDF
jgi:hypothetical protein